MWVFGYGSLMWEGWEKRFEGVVVGEATLYGYHRAFNKKSTKNWGTKDKPGPTLGLEPDETGRCTGVVFEIPETRREEVLNYLAEREGKSVLLLELDVQLKDGTTIKAVIFVNDRTGPSYVGLLSIADRAQMARSAVGRDGTCRDYVRNVRARLQEFGIADPHVEEFWRAVEDP